MGQVKMYEDLLDELWELTELEKEETLTQSQRERYLLIVEILHENNREIPFGIEI